MWCKFILQYRCYSNAMPLSSIVCTSMRKLGISESNRHEIPVAITYLKMELLNNLQQSTVLYLEEFPYMFSKGGNDKWISTLEAKRHHCVQLGYEEEDTCDVQPKRRQMAQSSVTGTVGSCTPRESGVSVWNKMALRTGSLKWTMGSGSCLGAKDAFFSLFSSLSLSLFCCAWLVNYMTCGDIWLHTPNNHWFLSEQEREGQP